MQRGRAGRSDQYSPHRWPLLSILLMQSTPCSCGFSRTKLNMRESPSPSRFTWLCTGGREGWCVPALHAMPSHRALQSGHPTPTGCIVVRIQHTASAVQEAGVLTSKAQPGGKGDRYAGTVEIMRLSPSALSAPQYSGKSAPFLATSVYLLRVTGTSHALTTLAV